MLQQELRKEVNWVRDSLSLLIDDIDITSGKYVDYSDAIIFCPSIDKQLFNCTLFIITLQ